MENAVILKELKRINGYIHQHQNHAKAHGSESDMIVSVLEKEISNLMSKLKTVTMVSQDAARSHIQMSDFPKIECPFMRKEFRVNIDQWKKFGPSLGMRSPHAYLVVNEVNPGYEWVFEDPETFCVEKLDGTNVKILVEDGRIVSAQNRKNVIDRLRFANGQPFLLEALAKAGVDGLIEKNGEQAGEVIGPLVNKNMYDLAYHLWFPFDKAILNLTYGSFNKHARTFDNLSLWFKDFLHSRLYKKLHRMESDEVVPFAEGVVFYNFRRRDENKSWRAKLRRDMFEWFYSDKVEILGYPDHCVMKSVNQNGDVDAE